MIIKSVPYCYNSALGSWCQSSEDHGTSIKTLAVGSITLCQSKATLTSEQVAAALGPVRASEGDKNRSSHRPEMRCILF